MLKRIAPALLAVALVSIFATGAWAQTEATISGVLADASGAGVPGASLTLTNQDTGVALITEKSDSTGNFAFQAVPAPGNYSISIQATGFSRLEQKNIVLTAGERRSVGTLNLAVGSTNDSVTVQA
ncbi:MAG: carboxypeptidase-like regulatory domain-containing protein, partial [Acidobacteriota bacterium]|nr:carboxypeptidase-like regulatory domain-containing protein [Acidobacteriota bacterium]